MLGEFDTDGDIDGGVLTLGDVDNDGVADDCKVGGALGVNESEGDCVTRQSSMLNA